METPERVKTTGRNQNTYNIIVQLQTTLIKTAVNPHRLT